MKTLFYSILAVTLVLVGCFLVNLILTGKIQRNPNKTKKIQRIFLLVLPISMLLLFISLFVGAGICRNQLCKELTEMKEDTDKRGDNESRLSVLEARNRTLTYIIGRDEEAERLISDLEKKP